MKRLIIFILFFLVLFCGVFLFFFFNSRSNVRRISPLRENRPINCNVKFGLDRNICKFINFQQPYSNDDVVKKLLTTSGSANVEKLGLEHFSRVEGLYLGYYVEKSDYILMILGFDDKNGGRFVVPVKIPVYSISDQSNEIFFFIRELGEQNTNSVRSDIKLKNKQDIISFLEKIQDKVVVLMLMDNGVDIESSDKAKMSNNISSVALVDEINRNTEVNRLLLNNVYGNGIHPRYLVSDKTQVTCNEKNDLETFSLTDMPIVTSIMVFTE